MKKIFFFILVVACVCISKNSLATSNGFLKPYDYYNKAVVIPNPENNLLAETFLVNGIEVLKEPEYSPRYFNFKTIAEKEKVTVFIYYDDNKKKENGYVGKFVFTKTKDDSGPTEESFVKEFVSWMMKNAWGKKGGNK